MGNKEQHSYEIWTERLMIWVLRDLIKIITVWGTALFQSWELILICKKKNKPNYFSEMVDWSDQTRDELSKEKESTFFPLSILPKS